MNAALTRPQFISVVVVFVVGALSVIYPESVHVGWILTCLTALAALLSGKTLNMY